MQGTKVAGVILNRVWVSNPQRLTYTQIMVEYPATPPGLLSYKQASNYASVNSTCAHPPPPGSPPGISIAFALDGKFPGVRTLELANPPGWGRKKRANAPSSVNSATFFIDRTVQ